MFKFKKHTSSGGGIGSWLSLPRIILRAHYWGEVIKLLFTTSGVFIVLLILIAAFQATGISFFLAKLFTGKAMEILRIAFGFVPKDTYRFALTVSFGFAFVYEVLVFVFSRNNQHRMAILFTVLATLLSLASYVEIIKDATSYYIFGLNVMKIVPLFVAALPAIAHYVISEKLVNKSSSFASISSQIVAIKKNYEAAKADINAAIGSKAPSGGGGSAPSFGGMPRTSTP